MHPLTLRLSLLTFPAALAAGLTIACGPSSSSPPPSPGDDASTSDAAGDALAPADAAPGTDAATTADADAGAPIDGGPLLVLTGAAGGVTLTTAADGYGRLMPGSGAPGAKSRFFAVFSDKTNLCGAGDVRQEATLLNLDLESPDTTFAPGTYPIYDPTQSPPPPYSDAPLVKLDGTCKPVPDRGAKSGTVIVTSVTSTAVTGTFDVTYSDGAVHGSFNVPLSCPSPAANSCAP